MNRKMIFVPALAALALLAGCNTVAGLGKDLQAGGRAIAEASDEVADSVTGSSRSEYAGTACDPELEGGPARPNCR